MRSEKASSDTFVEAEPPAVLKNLTSEQTRELVSALKQMLTDFTAAEEYLTPKELADRVHVSLRTLQRLNAAGRGPPRIQVSPRRSLHPWTGAQEWFAEQTSGGTKAQRKKRMLALRPKRKAQSPDERVGAIPARAKAERRSHRTTRP
jgi:hypothetical protein